MKFKGFNSYLSTFLLTLICLLLFQRKITATNCSSGCLSCSPLDYCLLCDSQKMLVLKSTFSPLLPFPHVTTECVPSAHENCSKIDFEDNCLFCEEGYFPRDGVCIEADVKVGGCMEQIDNGVCNQCRNNFKLNAGGECVAIDIETIFGEGCKTVMGINNKCIECTSSYVMDDLGVCRKESDLKDLLNKEASTLMVPSQTEFNKCKVASRFECKACANSGFEANNSSISNEYYLVNILGASNYILYKNQNKLDLKNLLETETPFIDADNGTYSLTSLGIKMIFFLILSQNLSN